MSYPSEMAGDRMSPSVRSSYTPTMALGELLAGTGLTYKLVNERTMTLERVAPIGAQVTPERLN